MSIYRWRYVIEENSRKEYLVNNKKNKSEIVLFDYQHLPVG